MLRIPVTALAGLAAGLVAAPLAAQNAKILHNTNHATGFTRPSWGVADTLYFVQPEGFRYGHGDGTGVRIKVQDSDQSTSESLTVGFASVLNDQPVVANPIATVTVSVFGTGSGVGTATFTVSLANPIALPATVAILATLPAPRTWPSDALTIEHQLGSQVKYPAGVTRPQWTWRLDTANQRPLAYLEAGSTFALGGLYAEPVLGLVNRTSAYGSPEDVTGPEALYHDSSRKDGFGYYLQAAAFKSEWAIVIWSNAKVAPLASPIGPILISAAAATPLPLPVGLDANGYAATGTVVVPPGKFTVWSQGAFVNFTTSAIRTGDACSTQTQ